MALAGGDDLVCDFVANPNPATCVPIDPDDRFQAIVLLDGSNQVLKWHELQRIVLPSIGIGEDVLSVARNLGVADESWQARAHVAMAGRPKYRVDLGRSLHIMNFTNQCQNLLRRRDSRDPLAEDLFRNAGCGNPEFMNYSESQRIINEYAVAFLKGVLAGDVSSDGVLTPGWAISSPSDVQFFLGDEFPNGLQEDTNFRGDVFSYLRFQPGHEHEKAAPSEARGPKDPSGPFPGEEPFPDE